MYRYQIIIEYDGTNYVGWQSQINGKSIQSEIEKTLSKIGKSLNKDHATVLHGIKTLNNLMLDDAKIYKVYIELYDLCSKISGAKKKKHTLYFELSNKIRNQNKLIKELQEKIKYYESIVEGHFTESR